MRTRTTQIGHITLSSSSLQKLQQELSHSHAHVTHPQDGIIFTKGQWTHYEQEVDFYHAIKNNSFHLVANEDGHIDANLARQLLYAMAHHQPIVMLQEPVFVAGVDQFARQVIKSNLATLTIAPLLNLDTAELTKVIEALPEKTDYNLTSDQLVLIRARVKAYFRQLIQEAKTTADAPRKAF